MKKCNWVPRTKLSPSNFTKIETPSQVASKMHAAMWRESEQDGSMEVNNVVNSQRIIWFIQGIRYE